MPYEIDDTQINLHGYGTPISFYDDNRTLRCEIYLADDNTLRVCGNPVGGGGAGAPTNHSTLSNLAADDHIQYLLKNGTRPLTGNWDAGIFDIISDTVGADSLLYAGVIVPSWKFSIGSADDTDQIGIYHDNTDAFITTDDGRFIFVTDEGANTDTYVLVRGKGTGVGHLTVHDEDNAEYVELTAVAGAGYVRVAGITPGILHIQDTAEANVTVFSSAVEGETRELLIYGFRAADAQRSLEIGVGVDAADTASFDGVSNYWFDGTVNAQTALQIGGTSINTGGTLTNVAYLNQANSFTLINPLTTIAESWIGPSATAGLYFKNGNIGFGDTNPGYKFSIIRSNAAVSISDENAVISAGLGGIVVFASSYITGGAATTGGWIKLMKENATSGQFGYHMQFTTRTHGSAVAERMRITAAGNLLVGTTTDNGQRLQVYKVGTQLKLYGGAADYMTVAVAADGATTFTTVDSTGALANIILAPDGVVISNANVNVTGMVRQTATWHAYGGFEDQAETIACGAGDWNHITNVGNNLWTLDENDGITIAADVFTITNTGDYAGNLSLSISALTGKDFHVRVYNNTQARVEGRAIGISTTGAGNEMNVSVPIYIEATAGDALQFEIMSADGTDPDADDGLFYFAYLHD